MTTRRGIRARLGERGWPVAECGSRTLAYIFVVEAVVVLLAVLQIDEFDLRANSWVPAAVVIALAIGFEEATTRAARLRLRIGDDLKQDMTSVWAIASTVALRPGPMLVAMVTILTYIWLRQERPAGQALHKFFFNAADAAGSCLATSMILHAMGPSWGELPWALGAVCTVVTAIVSYALLNRLVVTGFLVTMRISMQGLMRARDENLIELATLCLGGLVAVTVHYQPLLAVLALAPLAALQRGALMRQFETAATTDAKTGLLNAVALEYVGDREVSRATRASKPVGVLIMDLDRFKQVNDIHGHLAGDKVLKAVGHCLQHELREYDTVGRFGGEEFVAVLPDADDAGALVIAERLRSKVNQLDLATLVGDPAAEYELSISIGVAVLPYDGEGFSDLLRAADSALYRAKDAGRNRVVLADRGTGESVEPPVLVD